MIMRVLYHKFNRCDYVIGRLEFELLFVYPFVLLNCYIITYLLRGGRERGLS